MIAQEDVVAEIQDGARRARGHEDEQAIAVARVLRDRVRVAERPAADQHVAAIAGHRRAAPVDVVAAAPRARRRDAGEEQTGERDDGREPHAETPTQQPLCPRLQERRVAEHPQGR